MNKKLHIILFLFLFAAISSAYANFNPGPSDNNLSKHNYEEQIKNYPCYKMLTKDAKLSEQFEAYMKWLSELTPDAKLVYGYMQKKNPNIFELSFIFHEKVEFYGWLQLGHKFEDIMNLNYYQEHYPEVYPIAHRRAVIEEIGLVKFFAHKQRINKVPELAYMLVSPLCDINSDVPIDRLLSRLKYNPEYLNQMLFVTKKDLKKAVRVFKLGGYKYDDQNALITKAYKYVQENKNKVWIYPEVNI
jgi:hypothetical protein